MDLEVGITLEEVGIRPIVGAGELATGPVEITGAVAGKGLPTKPVALMGVAAAFSAGVLAAGASKHLNCGLRKSVVSSTC